MVQKRNLNFKNTIKAISVPTRKNDNEGKAKEIEKNPPSKWTIKQVIIIPLSVLTTGLGLIWGGFGFYDIAYKNGYEAAKKIPTVEETMQKIETLSNQNADYLTRTKQLEKEKNSLLSEIKDLKDQQVTLRNENQKIKEDLANEKLNDRPSVDTNANLQNIKSVSENKTAYFFNNEIYLSVVDIYYTGIDYSVTFNVGSKDRESKNYSNKRNGETVVYQKDNINYDIRIISIDENTKNTAEFEVLKTLK